MIEKELKSLVNEDVYRKLLESFDWSKRKVQINHYYSNRQNTLVKNGISIRIRNVHHKLILQIKKTVLSDGALRIKEEFERVFSNIPESIESQKLYDIADLKVGDVFLVGCLETERHIIDFENGLRLCLDKNLYLNYMDYEVEIEFENEIEEELLNLLKSHGVNFDRDAEGKYSRFIDRLRRQP